jgi:dGTPase
MRTPLQRDRDRIVHATAFRRLTYKTQVFVFHEGDHFRSRLTHTLEVAQIARAIARMLGLDEDLAEALALAHDLGHPPFGHAGERALDSVMAPWGGFDHNAQSLAVVTRLERKYMAFDGLNLTFETLEGLALHNGALGPGPVREALQRAQLTAHLDLDGPGALEAQAAAIADDIAYCNHDIDDGLRAGLLALDDLVEVPLVGRFVRDALGRSAPDRARIVYEVNRRLITAMIENVATHARAAVIQAGPGPTVTFTPGMATDVAALKRFLFERVYRHPRVMAVLEPAQAVVRAVFERLMEDPTSMPGSRAAMAARMSGAARASIVCDFVAGMTDRFVLQEHQRLFGQTPNLGAVAR